MIFETHAHYDDEKFDEDRAHHFLIACSDTPQVSANSLIVLISIFTL
jgi:hypothetical protein